MYNSLFFKWHGHIYRMSKETHLKTIRINKFSKFAQYKRSFKNTVVFLVLAMKNLKVKERKQFHL